MAELERRKFTAEEGVRNRAIHSMHLLISILKGSPYPIEWRVSVPIDRPTPNIHLAYNAFIRTGKSSKWCQSHAISFRAMSRAVSIRTQLKKYMARFGLPTESCEGDAKRLRRCLVSGMWRNGAKWVADGTYRSVRGNVVCPLHPCMANQTQYLV